VNINARLLIHYFSPEDGGVKYHHTAKMLHDTATRKALLMVKQALLFTLLVLSHYLLYRQQEYEDVGC
jgi:hypothetical protein